MKIIGTHAMEIAIKSAIDLKRGKDGISYFELRQSLKGKTEQIQPRHAIVPV